jgi:glyoxylase-like metal-dependent hydrolase (beta-lactamase superfamily II)
MRALAVDNDVIVFISRVWQTTCTAVRAGRECFLIDSVVYPDELAALPGVLEQASFLERDPPALLASHGDWDHLLGRLAFPAASLGCGESTARRLAAELGGPQRALRAFDEEHYVDGRTPLALAGVQSLPVPGKLGLGPHHELELHGAGGHTADGTAYWLPWLAVLVCGDYVSPVEIPMISGGGSLEAYAETLTRLGPLVERASTVIPGHGAPMRGEEALTILAQDAAYLEALRTEGAEARLPAGRRTARQRQIHAGNVERVGPTRR